MSNEAVCFSGVPFMIIRTKILDCHHGKDRNLNLKQSNKKKQEAAQVMQW